MTRPTRLSFLPRHTPVARVVAVSWLMAAAALASANDHAPAHAAAPTTAAAPAPAAAAHPAPDASAAAAAPAAAPARPAAGRDPLDIVRERLAEKLGATKAPGAPSPNVLRVVSRAGSGHAAAVRDSRDLHVAGAAPRMITELRDPAPHGTPARPAADAHAADTHSGVVPGSAHWDYAGDTGPQNWSQLKPEFAQCSNGRRQSPIDIRDGIRVQLDPVQFDYRPSGFRVIDNGHTVQVNVGPGNSIEVLGRRYDLVQFHFHRPSEERINGRQFDMVAHLVHKDIDGRLAVVAVLLDRGSAQPLVQTVWNNLPLEKGEEVAAQVPIDLNGLLPADRSYFTYMGSLTTPPCSEGVLWMVMKNPVPISSEQIGIFARLYPMNARPIQSAAGRLIKESN